MGLFRNIKDNGRLNECEDAIAKLRREFLNLESEWSNAYDKMRRMMMRTAKRAEVIEKSEEQIEEQSAGPTPNGEDRASNGRIMSTRQRELQQQILRRRAGG